MEQNCWNSKKILYRGESNAGYEDYMEQVQIKDVKKGDYFRRKPDAKTVYIRGQYDRTEKDYSCIDDMDINREIFLKGSTKVWVGFTY